MIRNTAHRVVHALSSLRWRLTLVYIGLLAVLLAALGTYQYFALRASLIANHVAAMQADYKAAHALLVRLAGGQGSGRQLCARAPVLASRSIATLLSQTSGRSTGVVVYANDLTFAAQAPADADLPRLDDDTLSRVVATRRRSDATVIRRRNGDALVVAFPFQVKSALCGVAQMSTPLAAFDSVLGDEVALTALGGGTVLIVALLLGLALTGRTLRPLRRLTHTAEQLAAGDLRARSRLDPRSDEVGLLAQSFDNMADRIEAAFAAQRESEAQVRRFIDDASHELRTPVTALKGYIDVLRRGAGRDPAALDAALAAMAREAERMRELVLDLLTLARLDAHRPSTPENFDVNLELDGILEDSISGMPDVVKRDFAPGPLEVRADRSAFLSIMSNLIANASKYAPGAAQRWSTAAEAGRVRIEAHDDGPGISPVDLPHVFERFYRGEKTRAREEGGSGLGLSIVQGLVHAQGGEVAIRSVEGSGTTVTVWLPLAP